MPSALKPVQLERPTAEGNRIEILDRVLDKGIVVDAWLLLSVSGIDLVTVEARIVIASIETFRKHSHELTQIAPGTWTINRYRAQPRVRIDEAVRAEIVTAPLTPNGWARSIAQWPGLGFQRH